MRLFLCRFGMWIMLLIMIVAANTGYEPDLASGKDTRFPINNRKLLENEDDVNLYCLRLYYPQLKNLQNLPDGRKMFIMPNGTGVEYSSKSRVAGELAVNLREAMAEEYPLEPNRPDLQAGFSPGRKRSYELLDLVYGSTKTQVAKSLVPVQVGSKRISMAPAAAEALKRANLDSLMARKPELRKYLNSDGGFFWRKIAGENQPSAHSYGIAVDFSAKLAPYWRWSKQMPHPMQKTYPAEIVQAMEDAGFIWGGKWHEYDLMHFEYRPELLCKARLKRAQTEREKQNGKR